VERSGHQRRQFSFEAFVLRAGEVRLVRFFPEFFQAFAGQLPLLAFVAGQGVVEAGEVGGEGQRTGVGVARAFGETMAVTLVIGNSSTAITSSLFVPGYTMASAIANQFVEATGRLYFSAIVEIAVLLLLVALIVNTLARLLIRRVAGTPQGFAI